MSFTEEGLTKRDITSIHNRLENGYLLINKDLIDKLKEAYQTIIDRAKGYDYGSIDEICNFCGNSEWQEHKPDCIYIKAKEYLK